MSERKYLRCPENSKKCICCNEHYTRCPYEYSKMLPGCDPTSPSKNERKPKEKAMTKQPTRREGDAALSAMKEGGGDARNNQR